MKGSRKARNDGARPSRRGDSLPLIGWRECVSLPDIGLSNLMAKVDTGARTSSLHVSSVESFAGGDGREWLRLAIPVQRAGRIRHRRVELPSAGPRRVRSSTGHSSWRHSFRTSLKVGTETWLIAITLSDRSEMRYPMLIGRAAISGRYLVQPGRSYLRSKPAAISGGRRTRR